MSRFALFLALSFLLAGSCFANIINVPADQPTIQTGINALFVTFESTADQSDFDNCVCY